MKEVVLLRFNLMSGVAKGKCSGKEEECKRVS